MAVEFQTLTGFADGLTFIAAFFALTTGKAA